jgi:16S rRNA (cytidine1402-2'-O)-methyltransferase
VTGRLVLVATPIGNLGDLSPRAVDALRDADAILCEDTRRTRALLTHAGLRGGRRLHSMPAPAEAGRADWVVDRAQRGETVVLVTDAGMPAISDPGARLVRACLDAEVPVDAVPGPDAATTALVLSGLPTDRFAMEGFLPRKGRARAERLAEIARDPRTSVIYESPRRLVATLADLADRCGADRPAAVARELTKAHQEVVRRPLGDLVAAVGEPVGECVIVVGGRRAPAEPPTPAVIDEALRAELAAGRSTRDAVAAVTEGLGLARREVYERAVRLTAD